MVNYREEQLIDSLVEIIVELIEEEAYEVNHVTILVNEIINQYRTDAA